jgi:cation diffusion facilitator CzcD-associated flavoprotein CzcO
LDESATVIVGGGPAGLSSAGALRAAGFESVVLERDDRIGGSWLRRYERLHLHTVRRFSGLAHFPIPSSYPKYVSKDQYAEYLREYASHFKLDVRLGCDVRAIRLDPAADFARPSFIVETSEGTRRAARVVVATGMYRHPASPAFPGLETYGGIVVHSSRYKTGRDFAGKRVLVVGIGNTGAELVVDLAEQGAALAAISVRTPPPVVPRDVLGRPVQISGMLLSHLPPRLADTISRTVARTAIGDLSRYGLGAPQWLPFSSKRVPVIDVGFVAALKDGRVVVRPNISRFTPNTVVFADGREESFDVVIFATGYSTGLDELVDIPGVLNERAYPLVPSGAATSQPGLYFMGFLRSNRGHLFETNLDSRRLAAAIAGEEPPAAGPHAGTSARNEGLREEAGF